MARKGGDLTRAKILDTAEDLFSKNGFQGTSVNQICKEAMVNKALVYYYFKDKNDIVFSLFQKILQELSAYRSPTHQGHAPHNGLADVSDALREEISFLGRKKRILGVMLMESLKTDDEDMSLFKCVEVAMASNQEGPKTKSRLVHEFFTGFIPLIAWVTLADKWCSFFQCDKKEALELFVDAFIASHVQTHPTDEGHDTAP